ncbi:hypothetical protein QBC46DRAFT_394411 [Diplogelasinospora grovesii]|uniref:Uncharacterized protein n=1 Tax=Diplogelasinospora grovesii TaxID=303347 RepID=A0AAN6S173_9PEZI|nr:hypothetical protein QBC46DRAFT_394411 [Diplogelasinospora grovesii]
MDPFPGAYPDEMATPEERTQPQIQQEHYHNKLQKRDDPRGHAHTDSGVGLTEPNTVHGVLKDNDTNRRSHYSEAVGGGMYERENERYNNRPQHALPIIDETTTRPPAHKPAGEQGAAQKSEVPGDQTKDDTTNPPYWGSLPKTSMGGIYNTVTGHGSANDDHDQHHHMPQKDKSASGEDGSAHVPGTSWYPGGGVYNAVQGHGSNDEHMKQHHDHNASHDDAGKRDAALAGAAPLGVAHGKPHDLTATGPSDSQTTSHTRDNVAHSRAPLEQSNQEASEKYSDVFAPLDRDSSAPLDTYTGTSRSIPLASKRDDTANPISHDKPDHEGLHRAAAAGAGIGGGIAASKLYDRHQKEKENTPVDQHTQKAGTGVLHKRRPEDDVAAAHRHDKHSTGDGVNRKDKVLGAVMPTSHKHEDKAAPAEHDRHATKQNTEGASAKDKVAGALLGPAYYDHKHGTSEAPVEKAHEDDHNKPGIKDKILGIFGVGQHKDEKDEPIKEDKHHEHHKHDDSHKKEAAAGALGATGAYGAMHHHRDEKNEQVQPVQHDKHDKHHEHDNSHKKEAAAGALGAAGVYGAMHHHKDEKDRAAERLQEPKAASQTVPTASERITENPALHPSTVSQSQKQYEIMSHSRANPAIAGAETGAGLGATHQPSSTLSSTPQHDQTSHFRAGPAIAGTGAGAAAGLGAYELAHKHDNAPKDATGAPAFPHTSPVVGNMNALENPRAPPRTPAAATTSRTAAPVPAPESSKFSNTLSTAAPAGAVAATAAGAAHTQHRHEQSGQYNKLADGTPSGVKTESSATQSHQTGPTISAAAAGAATAGAAAAHRHETPKHETSKKSSDSGPYNLLASGTPSGVRIKPKEDMHRFHKSETNTGAYASSRQRHGNNDPYNHLADGTPSGVKVDTNTPYAYATHAKGANTSIFGGLKDNRVGENTARQNPSGVVSVPLTSRPKADKSNVADRLGEPPMGTSPTSQEVRERSAPESQSHGQREPEEQKLTTFPAIQSANRGPEYLPAYYSASAPRSSGPSEETPRSFDYSGGVSHSSRHTGEATGIQEPTAATMRNEALAAASGAWKASAGPSSGAHPGGSRA